MDHFDFVNGVLHAESVDLPALAQQYGTPLYVYSRQTLVDHFARIKTAFAPLKPNICFSVKSCHNLSILHVLRELGSSFDVVSGGELARVLEAGAEPARVVFAGVGKTDQEIRAALKAGIGWFNVESPDELDAIGESARAEKRSATIALRINPDVDPKTHVYTTTGKRETKFGIDVEQAREVARRYTGRPELDIAGIHVHIGSPVNTVEPYVGAIRVALQLIDSLYDDGVAIRALNIGGGFGAHYNGSEAPPASTYAEHIVPVLRGRGLEVLLEPGRSIAANAGVLIARVLYTKSSGSRQFVVLDAAMTELIRPALYGSFHFIWPVAPVNRCVPPRRAADVRPDGGVCVDFVGPVCESGDFLGKERWVPPVKRGDLVCVFGTGAYGAVMGSQYNSRPRAAEVLVNGSEVRIIRRRETYDEMVALERVADVDQEKRR